MDPFLKYLQIRSKEVFVESDATTIRTLLAFGSLGWSIGLWLPLDTFTRAPYAWMSTVASEFWWGMAMFIHFIGVIWRLYDPISRPYAAFWINAYGVGLWTFLIGCMSLSIGVFSPGLALEICLVIAAWVVLPQTGSNEGKGTP